MIIDKYYQMDSVFKKNTIKSLRYWMMFDLFMGKKIGNNADKTNVMLANLKSIPHKWFPHEDATILDKSYVDRIFTEAWNGISSEFLKGVGVDSLLMTHRGLL